MENNNNKNIILIYFLVIFFAVSVGSGIFLVMNNKKNTTDEQAVSTEMSKSYINLKNDLASNLLSSPVNLTIVANSNSENITAFDILVSYDQLSFDFIKAESLDPNFKLYSHKNDNSITLTVVKTGSGTTPSVFNNAEIINLVFRAKKTGQFTFKVIPSAGEEATKFVNNKTEVIYPSLNEIKITVN